MKGIYLTQETKQEIEAKIVELEKHLENVIKINRIASNEKSKTYLEVEFKSKINIYKIILSSATILPVEESWQNIAHSTTVSFYEFDFPQGVIIQPKK
jgi:ribosome-associated translation inhibitor RaiA